jgi:hypothetical protein
MKGAGDNKPWILLNWALAVDAETPFDMPGRRLLILISASAHDGVPIKPMQYFKSIISFLMLSTR